MSAGGHQSAAQIRSRVNHPVVDGDGHWVEYRSRYSPRRCARWAATRPPTGSSPRWRPPRRAQDAGRRAQAPPRRDARFLEPPDRQHARPRDRDDAADALRAARRDRLRFRGRLSDRRTCACRASRTTRRGAPSSAPTTSSRPTISASCRDRMTPAAIIPMHTPEEAIAELEFVTKQLGSKVGMFGSGMPRQVPSVESERSGRRPARRLVRRASASTALRLRPGVGEVRRGEDRADLPQQRQQPGRCATRRPTSSTTISAISRPPATRPPRASSSAASRGASPSCASPSSKAASAGAASCSAT